mgnify:CR=1 FL=1
MDIFNIIGLFGGLALFLYGMRLMGDGLRQSSSKAFKRVLEKLTNNPVISFIVGLLITAVIQSSTATIVITSGLVGAGLMTLHQSLGIILGANVGTTVTAQIIRLMDISDKGSTILRLFKPDTLAPLAAIIGILMVMFFKFKGSDKIGEIAMGFGILFTGLINMTAAVTPLSQSESFAKLFTSMADKPFLGFFAGAAVAFIIQSSSASIGILQALSITGQLSLSSIYSIIIGIYIGDCVTTAIVCSIGAKADAKRVGLVHIMFNLCSVVLVIAGTRILLGTGVLDSIWTKALTSGGIANAHTLFKLGSAIIVLPFVGLLEKASKRLIKDSAKQDPAVEGAQMLDVALYRTPSIALSSAQKVLINLAETAVTNFSVAIDSLLSYDDKKIEGSNEREDLIDNLTDRVEDYLIRLAPLVDEHGNETINFYMKSAEEFERIGDLAKNLIDNACLLHDAETELSASAKAELQITAEMLHKIINLSIESIRTKDVNIARKIEPLEEAVDEVCEYLRNSHVTRLKTGQCNADAGSAFLDILVNIERISDQCSNVGVHTLSLYNPKIAYAQHEYLNSLHKGADEEFNKEYKAAKDEYFAKLKAVAN